MSSLIRLSTAALIVASISACTTLPVDPALTPAQAKASQKQADFKSVCKYTGGAWAIAKPFAAAQATKLGNDGILAVKALDVFVTSTCAGDLDINNADAIIQKGYDIGGQVVALIIAAQK